MTEEKTKTEQVKVVEIATQTAPAIELPDGRVVDINGWAAWISNEILSLKSGLVGK